jgi:hypothetical protein
VRWCNMEEIGKWRTISVENYETKAPFRRLSSGCQDNIKR